MPDLKDGETTEMKGSGAKPYILKNTGGVYSCSCPAWRNQSLPIEKRTCKHLRKLRGDDAEKERTGGALPQRSKTSKQQKEGPPLLLAQSWDNALDLTDWWISEKLDGVRAYWDGKQFLSRQGNIYHAPDWFVEALPEEPLDGELWIARKAFQRTVSIVRRQDKSDHWKDVRFLVFDAPRVEGDFETRMAYLSEHITSDQTADGFVDLLEHKPCRGLSHLQEELETIEAAGGEGLMLRQPNSTYEAGRSFTLLKVKSFHDADAVVTGHQAGKGKHKGKLGALEVELPDGTAFKVGTGFSDKQRLAPPRVGETITFRYQELSDGGVPRFPSFVRVRDDIKPTTPINEEPAKKTMVAVPDTAPTASPTKRHFEYIAGKSEKFWEIGQEGTEVTVRFGRIGTKGQTKTKSFDDEAAAQAHRDKMIAKKTGDGYTESG